MSGAEAGPGRPAPEIESLATRAASPAAGGLASGTVVARRYRILEEVGAGSMGTVYRALDGERGEAEVAVKMLRPEVRRDPGFRQRLRNELDLAKRMRHPQVVRVHDFGEDAGAWFVVMDFVRGRPLSELLAERGSCELAEASGIVRQVAEVLAEAHRCGVVHRDLKPANVLIDDRGRAWVTDFGVAHSLSGPRLTRTGEVLGTPSYLSPEQARGERVDGRSDLYTLGLVFLELLSGRTPAPEGTFFEVVARRGGGEVPSLAELGLAGLPRPWAAVLGRCLETDPQRRYATADELLAALPGAAAEPARRGSGWVVLAIAAGLLAAAAWWWLSGR